MSLQKRNSPNLDRDKCGGIPSASGSGTISRTEALGWAFNPKKKDPVGCVYVERTKPPARQPKLKLEARTFEEWVEAGYRVSKGMKSAARNKDGKPTFAPDQVWLVPPDKREQYLTPTVPAVALEAKARAEARMGDEEARHEFMDPDFEPEEFTLDESPPW